MNVDDLKDHIDERLDAQAEAERLRDEQYRQNIETLFNKIDGIAKDQAQIREKAAAAEAKAEAVEDRVEKIETKVSWAGLGIIAAAALFVWDKATGKAP